jgi:outer membrane protein assembly factor BamB
MITNRLVLFAKRFRFKAPLSSSLSLAQIYKRREGRFRSFTPLLLRYNFYRKGGSGRFRILIPFFAFLILNPLLKTSFAQQDLGVPVREALCWGTFVGPGKTGEMDTIYLSFGQYNAPLFLLTVNPDTGQIRQFNGPLSSEMGSWGFTIDHENRIYLGSYYSAHLLRFDPKTEKWDDLGQPAGESESFICKITTGRDGKIWGGTYPSAKLFSYDPMTGMIQNYGRMDPDQFYCYPTAGEDGLIYCAIQFEKVDIVVFDPEKKTRTSLLPAEERKPGRVNLIRGRDEKIYARLSPLEKWFRIEGEKLFEVSESDIPFPQSGLPGGRTFRLIDGNLLRIENPQMKEEREIPLRYEAAGSYIFAVATGPDGKIYGSSMLPLRLFVYDPHTQSMKNLGKASMANGEVYSMGALDDRLFLCSYPEARLSVYDPNRPLRFGDQEDSNPKDLGPMGGELYRPRAMLTGPHGNVYIGGYPDYGLLGGAISVYDPKKSEKRVYRNVIMNQSISSLAYIEKFDLIAGGGSIRGGTGTHAAEKEAKLMLWDPEEEWKISEIIPVPGATTILSLAVTTGGTVYGITNDGKVFSFDPERVEVIKIFDLGLNDPIETSLQLGPGGKLYGLAKEAIFAIDPKDDQVSFVAKPSVPISSGMAMLGRKIYFGSGANLWEFEIPVEVIQTTEGTSIDQLLFF